MVQRVVAFADPSVAVEIAISARKGAIQRNLSAIQRYICDIFQIKINVLHSFRYTVALAEYILMIAIEDVRVEGICRISERLVCARTER